MKQPAGKQEVEAKPQEEDGAGATTGATGQPAGKQEVKVNAVGREVEAAPQEDKKQWWRDN